MARTDGQSGLEVSLHRLIVMTCVLAVTGGILIFPVVLGQGQGHPESPPGPARGETAELDVVVETRFGALAVGFVEMIPGLTAKDLAGMTHGIQDLVPAGQELVQVSATITNSSDTPFAYTPRQFAVRLADGTQVPVSGTAAVPGVLPPDARVDLRLDFVVPGDGGSVWLRFLDGSRIVEIDLGRTLIADTGGGHGHAP